MDSERAGSPYTIEQAGLPASEKITALFQSDTLLAARYFDDRRGKTLVEPEKRLMLAILEDAINCFQENQSARNGRRKRIFTDAQGWIFEVGGDWVFGFENICMSLGFNPEYIRKGLARWREKKSSKHRSAPALGRNKRVLGRIVHASNDRPNQEAQT